MIHRVRHTAIRSRAMRSFMCVLAMIAALAVLYPGASKAIEPVQTGSFSDLAVGGYDAVAYFTKGKPVRGSAQFSTKYKGATWRFSSAENLAMFKANPAGFAPQYGGYCAWAMAQGYPYSGDPRHWKIVKGKLYLNANASVQRRWQTDIAGFIKQADTKWPAVLRK